MLYWEAVAVAIGCVMGLYCQCLSLWSYDSIVKLEASIDVFISLHLFLVYRDLLDAVVYAWFLLAVSFGVGLYSSWNQYFRMSRLRTLS